MLEYDPKTSLRHWPTPMAQYGLNPYGEPKWRIVFAPSRRILAGNQQTGFHWVQAYRSRLGSDPTDARLCVPVWILEGWRSAWDFCKMSRERWNAEMLILGPYPERGEYDLCHVFSPVLPDDCNIEKLISWIEAGRTKSFQDNLDACRAQYDQETKDRQREVEGRIHNAYPAFGGTAIASSRVARGTKNPRIIRTAEEIGLPVGNNKFMQLRRPNGHNTATHHG